jgi:GNAT superfamily N-acetyltransferase
MTTISFQLLDQSRSQDISELLHELAPQFSIELLNDRLDEMFSRHYQCVGIYSNQDLVGVCGLWILIKYYTGRHLEPDNVYIKPEFRNQGIGQKLNDWLVLFAKQNDCKAIELNCYNSNLKGHAFWHANGFEAIGLHFSKNV